MAKLEESPTYNKYSLEDLVILLKEIKNICLTYKGTKNSYASLHGAIIGLAQVKQAKSESVTDYAARIKNRVTSFFDSYVKVLKQQDENYLDLEKEADRKKVEDAVHDKYMAFIAIDKADPEIYKSLKDSLRQQYSVKQDNYPDTLAAAMEILNQNYKRKPKKQGSESGDKNEDQEVKSFAQKTKSGTKFWCFKCGRKECDPKKKDSCPMKDAEPTEWVAYKNMERNNQRSFAQKSEDANSVASNGSGITEASSTPSFQAFQFATFQFAEVNLKDDMSQVIL